MAGSRSGRRGGTSLGVILVFIVLVLIVPAVPALGPHPVNSSAAHRVTTAARVTSIPEAPSRAPTVSPSVAYTLDLCTNHLYTGNALPTDCSGAGPEGVAYDSGKGEVFVANQGSNNVSVISDATSKVVATIPVGTMPRGVAYDSGKGEVFVTDFWTNAVSVISDTSNTVVATIPVGSGPEGVAYDSGKGEVFVANAGSNANAVSVISDASDSVVATIPVGTGPGGVAYDSGKGEVFVTNAGSNTVSVISDANNTVVATIPVGSGPEGVAYDSGKGEVFVANQGSNNVSVISDANNTVIATIPVKSYPYGVAYDSGKGEVFVANFGGALGSVNVSVISDTSNTVTSTVTVGSHPFFAAYDLSNGYVYVSNNYQGTISIITTGPGPLTSVNISPSLVSLGPSASQTFTATPVCSATCPTGITYAWSLTNPSLGTLNSTSGNPVVFTAGNTGGTLRLFLNATLNGVVQNSSLINVTSPTIKSFRASPNPIDVGIMTTFSVNVTYGVPPYTYLYSSLPPGCSSASTSLLACTPTAPGTFNVGVKVTDSKGNSVSGATTLTVNPTLTVTSFSASPNPVDISNATTFSVAITGGTSPFTYIYSGLPKGCSSTNSSSIVCSPSTQGTYSVSIKVTDHVGANTSSTTNLIVNPPISISSFYASPNPITVGSTTTFVVSVTGGTTPYSYSYYSLPPGCLSSSNATLQCTPTNSGTFSVTVYVSDSTGASQSLSTNLAVNPGSVGGPVITSFTATPDPVDQYSSTTIAVVASGGTAPYTFSYTGLPPGCPSLNSSSFSCNPASVNTYSVTVRVTDAGGKYASATISLTVNSPLSPPSLTATPNPITVGNTTTISVAETGGSTPYTYSYYALPPGCTPSNAPSISCTPTSAGRYNVTATITDVSGKSVTANMTLMVTSSVSGGPSISLLSVAPNPVIVGNTTTITVLASGGTAPYSYSYSGLPPGCSTLNKSTLACTPTQSGTFSILVTVTDASHRNASASTLLVVDPAPLSIVSFTATPVTVLVNHVTILSVQVRGGVTPYSYTYTNLPPGCSSGNMSALSCTPTVTGKYTVTVTVHDVDGMKTFGNATLHVILPPPPRYHVTFSPSGLPTGTYWSMVFNSSTDGVYSPSSVTFTNFTNGSYPFAVGLLTGYTANPQSGSITVSGANQTITVVFTQNPPGRYSIMFTEGGLSIGTSWSVTFNGTTVSSTSPSIVFSGLLNGTYSFAVEPVAGYTVNLFTGTAKISGMDINKNVTFTPLSPGYYSIIFTETGLTAGATWSVTLGGNTISSTGASIAFAEVNGTYSYTIGAVAGYTANPASGSVKVTGSASSQSITFTSTTSPGKGNQTTGFLGLPGDDGYILLIVIAAVVVAVVVFALTRRKKAGGAPPPPPPPTSQGNPQQPPPPPRQ